MSVAAPTRRRVGARIEGTVQGVGFRPYVHRLVGELGLGGWVRNDARGVELEVEGHGEAIAAFLGRLVPEAPPLARIERVTCAEETPTGETAFAIRPSPPGGEAATPVSPDVATCPDCLAELTDPADRRFGYAFTNCTNCGPRFSIVRGVPYDRSRTTMAGFAMCPRCRDEYEDPADRRFHAQPNACPACGPALSLLDPAGEAVAGDPLAGAAAALAAGAIVAVKGVGGYHLACRADVAAPAAALRARKHREDKPFALLVPDVAAARALVVLGPEEEALLAAPARPIVLAPRRAGARVAAAVAPASAELGVMLPYSPLHHELAAACPFPLVLTSGNVSDEPIAFRDDDARARLGPIADLLLVHDRPIETRTDDSVARVVDLGGRRRPLVLRRSRGYVPDALALPVPAPVHLLGVGAELKVAVCLAKGDRAWPGPHVGDLKNFETLTSFEGGIGHLRRLLAIAPAVVAHDEHPDYASTTYARERAGAEPLAVQHHHAHLAAVLAEHGRTGPALGAIYDGTGLGTDGTVWGGELLAGDLAGCERVGHLATVRLPGGDRAVREPWRMAAAWLGAALGSEPALPPALAREVEPRRWAEVGALARSGLGSPVTSSMGRLFDAVGALCGLRARVTYEGQAAVELEAAVDPGERGAYELPVDDNGVLDARPTVRAVVADLAGGVAVGAVAARFHRAVAEATVAACARAAADRGLGTVVLAGGVFQNRCLLELTAAGLAAAGLEALVPERLPPNDGAIAYGQVAVAAARLAGAA